MLHSNSAAPSLSVGHVHRGGRIACKTRTSCGLSLICHTFIPVVMPAAIGLGVGNSYYEGSKTALGTQGTLDAVAGGILIYVRPVKLLCLFRVLCAP